MSYLVIAFMTDLKVMTADALGELVEEGYHHFLELGWLDHVEDLFELVQKHNLLGGMHLRPIPQEIEDNLLGERGILLQELNHAVGQLGVVHGEGLHLRGDRYIQDSSIHILEFWDLNH